MITINGMSLTVEQVAAVARNYEQVVISEEAKQKVNKARAYVEKKLDEKLASLNADFVRVRVLG